MSNIEIVKAIEKHPKLIERPIVIKENRGIISRPQEKAISLLA